MTDSTKALILFEQNTDSVALLGNLSPSANGKGKELNTVANNKVQAVASEVAAQVFLFYSDYITKEKLLEQNNWVKLTQFGETLPQKLHDAFHVVKSGDYKKIVFVNSFTENLSQQIIDEAFKKLDNSDVVMGTDTSNNCYLLGFTQFNADFFNEKNWNYAPNAVDIENEADKLGFSIAKLPQLSITTI